MKAQTEQPATENQTEQLVKANELVQDLKDRLYYMPVFIKSSLNKIIDANKQSINLTQEFQNTDYLNGVNYGLELAKSILEKNRSRYEVK